MLGGGNRKEFGQTNVSQAARPRLHSLAADLQNLGQGAPGASKRYNALQVRGPGNRASRRGCCGWGAPRVPRAPWWRHPEGRGRSKGRRLGAERRVPPTLGPLPHPAPGSLPQHPAARTGRSVRLLRASLRPVSFSHCRGSGSRWRSRGVGLGPPGFRTEVPGAGKRRGRRAPPDGDCHPWTPVCPIAGIPHGAPHFNVHLASAWPVR